MKFHNDQAEIFVPDNSDPSAALKRTTHLGIGAHQDDLEILAMHGILEGIHTPESFFTGITCTDGAGSPRTGRFADFTDEQMKEVRWKEQRTVAAMGQYSAMIQLKYPSSAVKDVQNSSLGEELDSLLHNACPSVVYTHNLADKHETHVAVASTVVSALRRLPEEKRPKHVYGVEVWRGLDWMPDDQKILLDVSKGQETALSLLGEYKSQIEGGKRYDLATVGRWQANATYFESHGTDSMTLAAYAMDLTPIVQDPSMDLAEFVMQAVNAFQSDVRNILETYEL